MIKKILFGIAFVASVVACTDDYKDWASPQVIAQPEDINFGDGSVSAVDVINFADFKDGQTTVKVCNLTAPTSSDAGYVPSYTISLGDKTFDLAEDGTMSLSEFTSYVDATFGKAPKERSIDATVSAWLSNGATTVKTVTSSVFQVKALPVAPFIDEGYYLTGDFAGWNKDGALAFKHIGDGNVYDNPEFQIVFKTTSENQYWKIISKTNYDDDFWSEGETGVVGTKVDGDTSAEGLLTTTSPQAGKIEAEGIYRLTINMMEYTYKIEKLSFTEYIYVPGEGQKYNTAEADMPSWGWTPQLAAALRSPNYDGIYTGFVYLEGGFKFTKERNWAAEYNWSNFNSVPSFLNNGAGTDTNLYCDDPGLYYLTVDVASGKITGEKITNMNLVGDFNGWNEKDDAQQMTWDAENVCFTITGAGVTANGWKFTANNSWGINLGGTSISDLVANGDNISVTGSTIKLYPCRTKSDKIYYTVE